MSDYLHIEDFLEPLSKKIISGDAGYKNGQVGNVISMYEEHFPDLDDVQLVIVGCGERRGAGQKIINHGPDEIRKEFYDLFYWHTEVKLADIGNIRTGDSITDTYAALKIVLKELMKIGKLVVILGGSQDLTLAQYYAFAEDKKTIHAACIDSRIDIDIDSPLRSNNFLMELLTAEPNYLSHYNHLAFQSYFVHPRMLETMDKLRFDCFRLGIVKEKLEEMEPVIRNCQIMTFDIAAFAHAYAPSDAASPNGLTGEEACTLLQFAGMSPNMQTVGIYGYQPEHDTDNLTAKQVSQMLWYLVDGKFKGAKEFSLNERTFFNEYHTAFAEADTIFLQSKKTGRWWMQLPNKSFIACSHRDYITASNNELPERWLRAQERL
jgi:arginase family enzyme